MRFAVPVDEKRSLGLTDKRKNDFSGIAGRCVQSAHGSLKEGIKWA